MPVLKPVALGVLHQFWGAFHQTSPENSDSRECSGETPHLKPVVLGGISTLSVIRLFIISKGAF